MFALIAVLLLAFALRIHDLDLQSIWDDEGAAIYRASLPLANVSAMTNRASNAVRNNADPPLYFFLLQFWMAAVGRSAYAARYLSLAFSVLLTALIFPLAKQLSETRTAAVVLIAAAASPFGIYYAQETRPYTLLAFLSALYLYATLRALGDRRWWLVVAIVATCLIYTHYYASFLLVARSTTRVLRTLRTLAEIVHSSLPCDTRCTSPWPMGCPFCASSHGHLPILISSRALLTATSEA